MAKRRHVHLDEIGRRVDAIRLKAPFGYIGVQTTIRELYEGPGVSATVSGCISMQNWGMELGVNTRMRPEEDTYVKDFLAARKSKGPGIFTMAEDASRHEFGHPKYCPMSLVSYAFIKNAVAEELQKLGINSQDSLDYTSNAFMDWIDNANVRAKGNGEGLTIFYYSQGDSEFYSTFIHLNMLTWGSDADKALIDKKFSANLDPATRKMVEGTASAFSTQIGFYDRSPASKEKTFEQKMAILNEPQNWENLARLFVRSFSRMMKHSEEKQGGQSNQGQQQNSGQNQQQGRGNPQDKGRNQKGQGENEQSGGNQGQSQDGKKPGGQQGKGDQQGQGENGQGQQDPKEGGKGGKSAFKDWLDRMRSKGSSGAGNHPGQKGKDGKNDPGSEEGSGSESPGKHMGKFHKQSGKPANGAKPTDKVDEPGTSAGENPFDKEAQTDEGKRAIMDAMIKAGKGPPRFMDPDEAVDLYYEMVAKPIPIKASTQCRGMAFPAIPFGAKEFDPERDEPDMISGIRISADGSKGLEAYSDMMDVNAPIVEKLVSHPDVCLIIDSSGSMKSGGGSTAVTSSKGNNAWGDRSSYHHALKSAHGIRNALRAKNILPFIRTNVIIFSDSTTSTGWQDYGRGAQGRNAMTKPLFGGTTLDPNELDKQLGSKEPSVVILISDGAIHNWQKDKSRIMQTLSRHYVAFIAIGGETETSRDMKTSGFAVVPVTSDSSLEDKLIDVTNQIYSGIGARQALESDWLVPK